MLISTYIYNSKVAVCEAVDEQLNGGKNPKNKTKTKNAWIQRQLSLTDSLQDTASSHLTTALTEHQVSESAASLEGKKETDNEVHCIKT